MPSAWLEGKITRVNGDARRTVEGHTANFFAFYNHDGQEGKHNLRLADYGHAMDVHESGKWVMLRKVV